jgi:hypothetical protein
MKKVVSVSCLEKVPRDTRRATHFPWNKINVFNEYVIEVKGLGEKLIDMDKRLKDYFDSLRANGDAIRCFNSKIVESRDWRKNIVKYLLSNQMVKDDYIIDKLQAMEGERLFLKYPLFYEDMKEVMDIASANATRHGGNSILEVVINEIQGELEIKLHTDENEIVIKNMTENDEIKKKMIGNTGIGKICRIIVDRYGGSFTMRSGNLKFIANQKGVDTSSGVEIHGVWYIITIPQYPFSDLYLQEQNYGS